MGLEGFRGGTGLDRKPEIQNVVRRAIAQILSLLHKDVSLYYCTICMQQYGLF
jgi:hypothetical protein